MVDAIGQVHGPAGDGARIVSLVPSLTELLFDLGLEDQVVGRTAYCVHPRHRVGRVTSVGGTKKINLDRLRALAPTHVLVNIDETPKPLADALAADGISVIVTHPMEVRDNLDLYRLIGGIFNRAAAAAGLARAFEDASAALTTRAADWPERQVLYFIWKDPWMTVSADTYVARLLALARLRTAASDPAVRYPVIRPDEALIARVDWVMFPTEPFPFRAAHLDAFCRDFPAHAQKAVTVDGEMLSWYGSRAIAALDYLRDLGARLATR